MLVGLITIYSLLSTGPTYNDVQPIFKNRCAQCHNEMWPDKNWLNYDRAFENKDKIKMRVENKTMPLGMDMPDAERKKIIEWVNQGAKR